MIIDNGGDLKRAAIFSVFQRARDIRPSVDEQAFLACPALGVSFSTPFRQIHS